MEKIENLKNNEKKVEDLQYGQAYIHTHIQIHIHTYIYMISLLQSISDNFKLQTVTK